jgi:hypothetical protein
MPLDIPDDWTPTSAAINALPEPLRRFIHDIETRADPAGDVRDLHVARENAAALAVRVATLSRIIRRALASGQLEKLDDAKLYLSNEPHLPPDGSRFLVRHDAQGLPSVLFDLAAGCPPSPLPR